METSRKMLSSAVMLGATILLTSSLACAAQAVDTRSAPIVAAAANSGTATEVTGSAETVAFPSSESGVRRAAGEGPESLRRYVQRTRMIYNYYYWSFAKPE